MCGFFGWIGAPPSDFEDERHGVSRAIAHRGPDDEGFASGDGYALGFRRLSILDLSRQGHQPMSTSDGRYHLVFNGEIYNYIELREALEARGILVRSRSDTEVLLHLLAHEGLNALARLNGMFAFAFIDSYKRKFMLVRDRLGKKPLYYAFKNENLRFASELKGLLAWPDAERSVDREGLHEYLATGYIPEELTIFQGFFKLPPAHVMFGSLDCPAAARSSQYWKLDINDERTPRQLSLSETHNFRELLFDAVRIRMRSDVPVGLFLSGGLDSGIVAALAANAGGAAPTAFTVKVNDVELDESDLATQTARHIGLEHHIIPMTSAGLEQIDGLAWTFDEPFGDASALPFFNVCAAAQSHGKVFLSGDGGDEAFAGYRRYIRSLELEPILQVMRVLGGMARPIARRLPALSLLRYRLEKSSLPDYIGAAAFDNLPYDPAVLSILPSDLRKAGATASLRFLTNWNATRGKGLTTRQQSVDYALYLPDDILAKVDRASMAHAIEVRSPFLDVRLVEWAASLPRTCLLNQRTGKLPLRRLARELLPEEVQSASKRGFGLPLDSWFREPAGLAFARERLLSPDVRLPSLWDVAGAEILLDRHAKRKGRGFGTLIWRLLMLEAWSRHYATAPHRLEAVT